MASNFWYTPKVTKSVAGCALHPSSARSCNKADGMRLPKEERHIETPDTAGDGGGRFACAVFSSAGCACLQGECGGWYRVGRELKFCAVGFLICRLFLRFIPLLDAAVLSADVSGNGSDNATREIKP